MRNGETDIFDRTFFICGPPRSGTTFAASYLNMHPAVVTAIDDHVYECWTLYYYRTRVGLVQDIRENRFDRQRSRHTLRQRLLKDGHLTGIAPSEKVANQPLEPAPTRPGESPIEADSLIRRHRVSLDSLPDAWRLCVKSPEISFTLQDMSTIFPEAKFIVVHRPVAEIAESMFRKGNTVKKVAVFQRRWQDEIDANGKRIPPPGVPPEWMTLWDTVTDFQRCAIMAASYLKALADSLPKMGKEKFFVYDHTDLRRHPGKILPALADFMRIAPQGFHPPDRVLNTEVPHIPDALAGELAALETVLNAGELERIIRNYQTYG